MRHESFVAIRGIGEESDLSPNISDARGGEFEKVVRRAQ